MTRLLSGALAASITLILACAIAAPARAADLTAFDATALPTAETINDVATGDLNRDGHPDLVAVTGDGLFTRLASSDGRLGSGATLAASAADVVLADTNQDGHLDALTAGPNGVMFFGGSSTGALAVAAGTSITADSIALAVGDLDRDGRPDVVSAGLDGTLHIERGLRGSWAPETTQTLAGTPTSIALADADGDGDLDVVVGLGASGVQVFVNDGAGAVDTGGLMLSFAIAVDDIVVADVDRDGRPDLVVAQDGGDTVEIAPGSAPPFTASHHTVAAPSGRTFGRIAVGDLDHDAIPDLVTSGTGLDVYPGHGDGTFAAPSQSSLCAGCAVTLSDRDSDGLLDVVWGDRAGADIGIARNTTTLAAPNATVAAGPAPSTAGGPGQVRVADLDRDGIPDLAMAEQTAGRVGVMLGNGDGTYGARGDFSPGGQPADLTVADVNRDGISDVLTANYQGGRFGVILGNGDGTFGGATTYDTGTFSPGSAIAVDDFNRDGRPDAVVGSNGDVPGVFLFLGNGDGTFASAGTLAGTSGKIGAITTGDFNRDGKPDVAAAGSSGDRVSIALGNGDGTFGTADTSLRLPGAGTALAIETADMNGDGKPDLVASSYYGPLVSVFIGHGDGTFEGRVTYEMTGHPRPMDVGDYNGDAIPDVVTADGEGDTVSVRLGVGDGTLGPEKTKTVGETPYGVAFGDLDRNGWTDIVATGYTVQKVSILLSTLDVTGPTTTDNVSSGWYTRAPVTVTLSASDPAGVAATYYTKGTSPADPTTSSSVYNPSSRPTLAAGERIKYFSVDALGNAEPVRTSNVVRVDTGTPTTTDDVPATWQNTPVVVTLTPTDTGGSGVDKTYYTIGTSPPTPNTGSAVYNAASKPTLTNGQKIRYFTIDQAGNRESPKTSAAAKVDTAAPSTTDDVPSGWQSGPVTVTLTPTDTGGSGIARTYYTVGASPATPDTSSSVYDPASKPTLNDGERIKYFTVDAAGNAETVRTSSAARVDDTPPATGDDVPAGWRSGPVSVTLTADDGSGSGAATTYYTVGTSPATPDTSSSVYDPASKPVLNDGERISYFSVDAVGNAETPHTSSAARIDTTPPTTSDDVPATYQSSPVTVTLTADDGSGSGAATTYYTVGTSPGTPDTSSSVYNPAAKPRLGDGERISYFSVDAVGNAEAPKTSAAAQVDPSVPVTRITSAPPALTSSPQPAIAFDTTAPDATFECSLDGAPFDACTSPFVPPTALSDGGHTVRVRAISRAGVVEPTPASAAFVVDTIAPPAPTLDSGPPAVDTQTSTTIAFHGEAGASFLCSVDGGAESACTSPLALSGLGYRAHTVDVVQRDLAGNRSPRLTVTWLVFWPGAAVVVHTDTSADAGAGGGGAGGGAGAAGPAGPADAPSSAPTGFSATAQVDTRDVVKGDLLIAGITPIVCRASGVALRDCSLQVRRRGAVLATAKPGTSTAGAGLALTRVGRRALRRSPGLRADLVLTATGSDGQVVTQTTTVVLRGLRRNALTLAYPGRSPRPSRALRTKLHRLAHALSAVPAVRCIADTDSSGHAAADRALTTRQARHVCAELGRAGLTARRTAVGRGGDHPRASNRTAAGRAKNRRVTISVGR